MQTPVARTRKPTKVAVNEAAALYQRYLTEYGPNNLATVRAEIAYRELLSLQRHGK